MVNLFKNIFRREKQSSTPATPRTGGYNVFARPAGALNVATVFRCVNIIADAVAGLPVQYMRAKKGVFTEYSSSRLHYLLTIQPNNAMSAVDFWRQVVIYRILKGNAYVVPMYEGDGMEISRLALVNPDCVVHDTDRDVYTIGDVVAGVVGTYEEEDVLHFKNYSHDGKHGISTLEFARRSIDIASQGDAETLDRFRNGGNIRGIVSNESSVRGFGEYQDEELKKVAESIDERFRNGERIVETPGQTQFHAMSMSSTDMQFLETRKFSVRDICRTFGVHPSFVFDDTSNNYKSAEMANVAFLSHTLNPILRSIEAELNRKLIPKPLCSKLRISFDRRSLYACDLDSRVNYQTKTIAAGIYTINDWRRIENQPEVEGGDKVMVSANLKSLTEFNQLPQQEENNEEDNQA